MADKRDYYEVLGVSKTASDDEIKKAFRTLAKSIIPTCTLGIKSVKKSSRKHRKPMRCFPMQKRKQYDQFGHAAFDGTGGGAGGFDFSGMDMGDIFGDIFGDFFGGGSRRRTNDGPMKGSNLRTSVRITFEEAIFGCEKEIEMVLRMSAIPAMEQVQSRVLHRRPARSAVVRERLYLHSSLSLVRCRMCRPAQTVVDPERSSKTSARIAGGTGYIASKKRFRYRFRQVSTTDRASVSGRRASRESTADREAICSWRVVVSRHPTLQRRDMNIYSTAQISFAQGSIGRRDSYSYGGR